MRSCRASVKRKSYCTNWKSWIPRWRRRRIRMKRRWSSYRRLRDLSRYAENLDLDPEQLSAIEQRISLFESLKRKYGTTISEVIAFGERAAERMRKIEGHDEELQRLTNEIATLEVVDLRQTGEKLRKLRTK